MKEIKDKIRPNCEIALSCDCCHYKPICDECMAWHKADKIKTLDIVKELLIQIYSETMFPSVGQIAAVLQEAIEREERK